MKNREIFVRNPDDIVLLNNGVAAMSDLLTSQEIKTLRFELEHFVCEGEYQRGLVRILESFMRNTGQPEQPAGWISGFFGSGKSHLGKMLHYLWTDYEFSEDGATARGLAVHLSQDVKDLLKELTTLGRRGAGLHAASGTLGAGAGESVRLPLLGIIFKSIQLPANYPQAKFCIWLKKNGIYEKVRDSVKAAGREFIRELSDLYVSPVLSKAMLEADPDFATDEKEAKKNLRAQFSPQKEITTDEFVDSLRDALAPEGEVPYTVIILDEVQQYIGDDSSRSYEVQEVVEACSKKFGDKILFVGTGQTALAGTPALQRLQGRFTVNVELSDSDVETVTRRVVLAKKPSARKEIERVLEANAGEIDRQLANTKVGPRSEDKKILTYDYPLLPVRRRFWENVLRAVDTPGTAGQLRTQLRMVYDAIRATADDPLGNVVPADFLYTDQANNLLQTGVLLREIHETIIKLDDGTEEGRLASRLCGLIFLIRKLPREAAADIGVRAKSEMLADLLVRDLARDGTALRSKIPGILDNLASRGVLLKIDEEYSLQTREGTEWEQEFRNRESKILNDQSRLSHKRTQLIAEACQEVIKRIKLVQGKSKEARKLSVHYGLEPPVDDHESVPVWVRDGWSVDERSALADSRELGSESPLISIFIRKEQAEALRSRIAELTAAEETLNFKGTPSTQEGREARNAMQTRFQEAEGNLRALVKDLLDSAKVLQGGGKEIIERTLDQRVREATGASLVRLFPKFREADDDRWPQVIERARRGAENPLEALDYQGKVESHSVCSAVLSYVGSGKKGRDIRSYFSRSPYGWTRDAISGALITLVASGHLKATQNVAPVAAAALDQTKIATADFHVESVTLTATQMIQLRQLFQQAGLSCSSGEESATVGPFLTHLVELARKAGGESPLPLPSDATHIQDIQAQIGNEQLLAILEAKETFQANLEDWKARSELADKRMPEYGKLKSLLSQAEGLSLVEPVRTQLESVEKERLLLESSDPIQELLKEVSESLRSELATREKDYHKRYDTEMKSLEAYESWTKITQPQRDEILAKVQLLRREKGNVGTVEDLSMSLQAAPLNSWLTMAAALPEFFGEARKAADGFLEPEIQHVQVSSGVMRTEEEVKKWAREQEQKLLEKLKDGPVVVE